MFWDEFLMDKNLEVWTMPNFGDVDQRGLLHIVVRNKDWYNNFRKYFGILF